MKTRIVIALALAVAVGCGKDDDPIRPSPPLTGLSITPDTNLIKIKGTETFSVTGTYSDGSTQSVNATWGSDNGAVATMDSSGRAGGVTSGQATIFADAQGQRATRLLRVVPDYHGRWQGDWTAAGCSDDGDWRGACAEFPSGSLWALWLDFTQTRDTISGRTDFGDGLAVAVAGTIMMNGPVVLNGTSSIVIEGLPMEATVSDWETITTDNERMTGRFRFTIRAAGVQGSLGLQGEARIVTKTSTITSVSATEAAGGFRGVIARSLRRKSARR
jgi:hypothetical protein